MMRLKNQLLLVPFLLSLLSNCFAQNEKYIGFQGGVHSLQPEFGAPVDQFIGVRYLQGWSHFQLSVSGNHYFIEDVPGLSQKLFDFNLDFLYSSPFRYVTPYGGAGINLTHYSAEGRDIGDIMVEASYGTTTPAFCIIAGARFPLPNSRIVLFAEFRYIFESRIIASDEWIGVNRKTFVAGILFRWGDK